MKAYVSRQQVREINRKLFANDLLYSSDDIGTLEILVANIIQRFNPEDSISGVPTILELKESNINEKAIDTILLLSTDSVILQINNNALADSNKVTYIKKLKELGYKIIIVINKDDKVFSLAKILADIIKFDIADIPDCIKSVDSGFSCKKLAFNVNCAEDFVLAQSANINYYEGMYISPTTTIEVNNNPHSEANFIKIIALINKDADIKELSEVLSRDSLLTAQVIRLSNSVYYGSRRRIQSVEDAIIRIGLNNLRRWIFLLQFSKNDNVPEQLLQISYHRAIFCEGIILENKVSSLTANDAYLIGLFSALDILTGRTLESELSNMNLSNDIVDALLYREGTGGQLLNLVKAYEEVNWDKVNKYIQTFNLNPDKLFKMYFKSLDEVTAIWNSLTEHGGVVQ